MDANFFKPFVDGAKHTLKLQCSLDAKPCKPFYKPEKSDGGANVIQYDIAGIIGLTSTTFTGSIALCFPKTVFLEIMGKMLGENFSEITDELSDGAAELLNIIFGQAKAVLNEQGHSLEKAIPTVIRGTNIQTRPLSKNPTIVLPFDIGNGIFHL